MLKNNIKKIILYNQDRIKKISIKKRHYSIQSAGNYVFVGSRRAGKTYFLYQIIKERYVKNQIKKVLYINFEDERLIDLTYKNLDLILESYYELFNQKPDIFFDEIQNVENWEKFIRRLVDNDYQVMVTGSNSQMLSSEIATTLGGRLLIKEIQPLSFKEFVEFNNVVLKENYEFTNQVFKIRELYNEYLLNGGFPETLKFSDKREYLSNLFQKLFYGDIIARYKISNQKTLKLLIKKIAESVNNETSINRIKNLIKSVGIPVGSNTLFEYLDYLSSSFMIFGLDNYANKFVERESKKKYYFSDTGLLNLFLIDKDTKLLENQIFIELRRRYKEQIYFIRRITETDFIVPEEKIVLQVSYQISNNETRKREIKGLIDAMTEFKINTGTIITFDTEEVITVDEFKINVVPAWKWLLS